MSFDIDEILPEDLPSPLRVITIGRTDRIRFTGGSYNLRLVKTAIGLRQAIVEAADPFDIAFFTDDISYTQSPESKSLDCEKILQVIFSATQLNNRIKFPFRLAVLAYNDFAPIYTLMGGLTALDIPWVYAGLDDKIPYLWWSEADSDEVVEQSLAVALSQKVTH